ncbi:MAG: DUF2252 domain-containing protein [Methylocystis sp.]|uniref:DUF2252 domain-containing protein n=1 Tax=Methylocystis sp. TaxID=1911079 RepID=UPI003DA465AF
MANAEAHRIERGRRELYKLGKSLRDGVPRDALADYDPPPSRDPLAIIETTLADRLPSLRPLRRDLMSESAFAFLRGTADVMAFDLVHQRAPGVRAQAGGDCHLMNFGAFLSPEGNVLFDVNDFDETLPDVDIVHDLRRLATSVVVAADDMGYSRSQARDFARRAVKCYRERIFQLAVMSPLEVWNVRVPLRDMVGTLRDRVLHDRLSTAIYTGKGPENRIDGLPRIEKTDKGWRIVEKPPKLSRFERMSDGEADMDIPALFEQLIRQGLQEPVATLFRRYSLCDCVFKAVGVGSVGVFCAIGLFMSDDEQPLAMQIKEAKPSVLERFGFGRWDGSQGKRVIAGQRVMQAASDIFLASADSSDAARRFYMRQLKTRRLGSISELLKDKAFPSYVELCGGTLARAHARSSQPAILAGYLGKGEAVDDALASFAMLYARQIESDFETFRLAQGAATSDKTAAV